MNISLTPELENFVIEKVNSGLYTSISEVIREALRLLNTYDQMHQKQLETLNQAIDIGMSQLKQGQFVRADDAYKRLHKKITAVK